MAAAPPPDHLQPEPLAQFLIELRSAAAGAPPARVLWMADDAAPVSLGRASITYLGSCLADDPARRRRCEDAVRRGRLAGLTDLPGSFHVVVMAPDVVGVFGDAVGLRRIFYARLGDVWLVSDRADVLARRIDAPLDDRWLALWLVWSPPEVTSPGSPWKGVDAVPPGGCLIWRPNQVAPLVELHWTPPHGDLALEDGAAAFAEALTTAVRERVRRAPAPSLDLSGGRDTVALAFLADEAVRRQAPGRRLLAVTLPSIAVDNDDVAWARAVAGGLRSVEQLVVPPRSCPLPFDDVGDVDDVDVVAAVDDGWLATDQPSVATMHSARRRHLAGRLRHHGRGADHLAGYGGDEVLQATPAYLPALLRRRPWLALARLRQHCALRGAPAWPAVRAALVPGTYRRWLARAAADVAARHVRPRQGGGLGWGTLAPPAPWLTERALSLAAEALADVAASAVPLGDVAQHAALARIQAGAATVRLHQQSMSRLEVRMHCPYLDRHVVEASLAVRADERSDPAAVKPLLDAALAATVPAGFRTRKTKSHYAGDTAMGLWRNRQVVGRVVTDARLADRGLVDVDALQRAVDRPREHGASLLALADVVGCERWLRSQEAAA